ncbi:hypothetical protein Tco_0967528 [Tanacetum coccineum]
MPYPIVIICRIGTNPHVLVEQTKSASEGLETILTKPITWKGASHIEQHIKEEFNTYPNLSNSADATKDIKLEESSNLVQNVEAGFIDLDSPKDEPIIVVDESKEEEKADKTEDVHATFQTETEDTPLEKNKAKAKVALLSDQPSFPNVAQLTEILIKSFSPKLSKISSTYDFSRSLPTKLKELPSKSIELTEELKELKNHVHELEIELPGDLKDIPNKLETFTSTIKSLTTQAKIKTLDALPSFLNKITKALNKFAQVIDFASQKTRDTSVPLAGQAGTQPAEGRRKQIKLPYLSYFKEKLLKIPPKSSSQTKGEPIKKDNGKKAMFSKNAEEEGSESNSDDTIHLTGFMYSILIDYLIRRIHQLDTTYQTFYLEHRIEFYRLNNVCVLQNNMAYSVNSIQRTVLQKIHTAYSNQLDTMYLSTDTETVDREITMAEPNDYISTIRKNFVSNDNEGRMVEKSIIKIQGTFLVKVSDNAFNGITREDAYKHIDKFLKVVGPIKIKGLTQDRFRLSENMVEKFIQKFYHLSDNNKKEETEDDDDPRETNDYTKIFKIDDDLFEYETLLCKAFNDFNYLLKIDTDLFTFEIQGMKAYEEYESNNHMMGGPKEPWSENRVPYQLCDNICEPCHFKNEKTKWPICNSDIDGFCNGGELPGMV